MDVIEQIPRKFRNDDDDKSAKLVPKLPVLDDSGQWIKIEQPESDGQSVDINSDCPTDEDVVEKEMLLESASSEENLSKKPKSFMEKRNEIGALAASIIENPQENVGKLKNLRCSNDSRPNEVVLSILTQLAVFSDLLPSYAIRELTDKETSVQVSKQVKQLRMFEQNLVKHYKAFISSMGEWFARFWGYLSENENSANYHDYARALRQIFKSQCLMLSRAYHFNFRLELLQMIIVDEFMGKIDRRAGRRRNGSLGEVQFAQDLSNSLVHIFRSDKSGEFSLEVVKCLSKSMKKFIDAQLARSKKSASGSQPRTRSLTSGKLLVLQSLLKLNLRYSVDSQTQIKKKYLTKNKKTLLEKSGKHVTRKQRKLLKMQKKVEEELKQAEASVDEELCRRMHTETLEHLFNIYFRVMKNCNQILSLSGLLKPCIEGIAKFGHLISFDYFSDILKILKNLLEADNSEYSISCIDRLECISCAFSLLLCGRHVDEGMALDLADYYEVAFEVISEKSSIYITSHLFKTGDQQKLASSICKCMEFMFLKRGQQHIEAAIASAFIKQLLSLCLTFTDPLSVIIVLDLVKRILGRCPNNNGNSVWDLFMDSEAERSEYPVLNHMGHSEILGNNTDVSKNHSGQNFRSQGLFWEFLVLNRHYDKSIRDLVTEIRSKAKLLSRT